MFSNPVNLLAWLVGYAIVFLIIWLIWERWSKKLALIILGEVVLAGLFTYLALAFSYWFVVVVVAILIVGWVVTGKNSEKTR